MCSGHLGGARPAESPSDTDGVESSDAAHRSPTTLTDPSPNPSNT